MSLIIFAIVLSVLIVVHEWGHFITARLLGVRVEKFALGFGPLLFSRRHKGTDYLLRAIPMGGYVKLAGDERNQCKGEADEFYSHPVGHRALIVAMGPIINFVFAYICFVFVFIVGYPAMEAKVGKVLEGYPALTADLREGDMIVRIDGQVIRDFEEMQHAVMTSNGRALVLTILRDKQTLEKSIVPLGKVQPNLFGEPQKTWLVGIQPKGDITLLKYSPQESLRKAGAQIVTITTTTFKALSRVVTGGMPAKDALAGPIRIFDIVKNAAEIGLSAVVYIVGVISTSLAIFNLFPIPVLDGGHLFFSAVEKLRGRPVSPKLEEGLVKVGLTLLLSLMVFVLYNDVMAVGWVEKVQRWGHMFKH